MISFLVMKIASLSPHTATALGKIESNYKKYKLSHYIYFMFLPSKSLTYSNDLSFPTQN